MTNKMTEADYQENSVWGYNTRIQALEMRVTRIEAGCPASVTNAVYPSAYSGNFDNNAKIGTAEYIDPNAGRSYGITTTSNPGVTGVAGPYAHSNPFDFTWTPTPDPLELENIELKKQIVALQNLVARIRDIADRG